jgi:protein-disulfide isomerase
MARKVHAALFAALVLIPLPAVLAAEVRDTSGGPARIEQAVKDYANKQRADQELARDRLVQSRMDAILHGPGAQVLGNPNGDVTIVEFSDYTCPFCKAAEPRIQQLLNSDKNVRLVVMEFPILQPVSVTAAKAALAAARQGRYAPYHRAMMEFRGQLTEELVFETAKEAGIDVERLKIDMQAPEIADAIIANFNHARALRIFETPTFIIGNYLVTEPSSTLDFAKAAAAARRK